MKLSRSQAQKLGIAAPPRSPRIAQEASGGQKQPGSRPKDRERVLSGLAQAHGLPEPVYEYPFAADTWIGGQELCPHEKTTRHQCDSCGARKRQWRFDMLFEGWLAVEQVGGVWIRGHHSRGQQQIDDMEKRNWAVSLGYAVLEFTPQQINSGEAFAFVKQVLEGGEQ